MYMYMYRVHACFSTVFSCNCITISCVYIPKHKHTHTQSHQPLHPHSVILTAHTHTVTLTPTPKFSHSNITAHTHTHTHTHTHSDANEHSDSSTSIWEQRLYTGQFSCGSSVRTRASPSTDGRRLDQQELLGGQDTGATGRCVCVWVWVWFVVVWCVELCNFFSTVLLSNLPTHVHARIRCTETPYTNIKWLSSITYCLACCLLM